jgi:pimeloyl-ACP methyl ester carboxylesterase
MEEVPMKPSIVFSHGIWADGSSFQKVIPALRAEGHQVIAAQYGLDTVKGDVEATVRTFARVSAPIVLVGHSYGGTVITHAGTDRRVAALVYIAALGPDETETSQGQQDKFPQTDVFKHIDVADGRVWMMPDGVTYFAGDLTAEEQGVVWSTHFAPAADLFTQKYDGGIAWRTKPSWSIVATEDHTVHPEAHESQGYGGCLQSCSHAVAPQSCSQCNPRRRESSLVISTGQDSRAIARLSCSRLFWARIDRDKAADSPLNGESNEQSDFH